MDQSFGICRHVRRSDWDAIRRCFAWVASLVFRETNQACDGKVENYYVVGYWRYVLIECRKYSLFLITSLYLVYNKVFGDRSQIFDILRNMFERSQELLSVKILEVLHTQFFEIPTSYFSSQKLPAIFFVVGFPYFDDNRLVLAVTLLKHILCRVDRPRSIGRLKSICNNALHAQCHTDPFNACSHICADSNHCNDPTGRRI